MFGTGSTARVLVPLLQAEGFEVHALWGRSEEEACGLAKELGIPFHTSQSDDVLLHQDVDLVCIYIPPSMTKQIAVKALGKIFFFIIQLLGKRELFEVKKISVQCLDNKSAMEIYKGEKCVISAKHDNIH